MGEMILAVCDRCKKKQRADNAGMFLNFLRRHRNCNFTGCRVVKEENPCPNREKHYTVEEAGVVFEQSYEEIIRD